MLLRGWEERGLPKVGAWEYAGQIIPLAFHSEVCDRTCNTVNNPRQPPQESLTVGIHSNHTQYGQVGRDPSRAESLLTLMYGQGRSVDREW
jgi:hypothetical protein